MQDVRELFFGRDAETRDRAARMMIRKCFPKGAYLNCQACGFTENIDEDGAVKVLLEGSPTHCGCRMDLESQ